MMRSPDHIRRFTAVKARFLKGVLDTFFTKEFPKLIGPLLRSKLVEELIKLLEKTLPLKDHVQPGQLVWNVVSIRTKPHALNPVFVPVILTMVHEDDIKQLTKGLHPSIVAESVIARIMHEAYAQGGLLSTRDIGLLTWRNASGLTQLRKRYERAQGIILPHVGSLQDMGSCISHKSTIVRKVVIEKKDPLTTSRETAHSMLAVDRYLKDFHRVRLCHTHGKDADFISFATGLNKHVVQEYIKIADECDTNAPLSDSVTSRVMPKSIEHGRKQNVRIRPEHSIVQGRRAAGERT